MNATQINVGNLEIFFALEAEVNFVRVDNDVCDVSVDVRREIRLFNRRPIFNEVVKALKWKWQSDKLYDNNYSSIIKIYFYETFSTLTQTFSTCIQLFRHPVWHKNKSIYASLLIKTLAMKTGPGFIQFTWVMVSLLVEEAYTRNPYSRKDKYCQPPPFFN